MIYQTFFINRTSGTSADTLLALGFAEFLNQALYTLGKLSGEIVIRQAGPAFEVTLPCQISAVELVSTRPLPLLELLISTKQRERQGKKGRILQDGFDYELEREKQGQMIAGRKLLEPALRTPDAVFLNAPALETLRANGPRSELSRYQAINMLKVPDTFNELVYRWQSLAAVQQWLAVDLLCQFFAAQTNNLAALTRGWEKLAKEQHIDGKATITAVQVINPTTGKGLNASKGNHPAMGSVDNFWLLELLKFKGFMLGAAPYVIKGSKDRKTYVILPEKIELGTLNSLMQQFREICWSSTAIKQDILASLRLAQVLVEHRLAAFRVQQNTRPWMLVPLISIAQGFDITSYKDMGSAHATINIATINLPNWFPELGDIGQLEELKELLQEHIRIIRRIEGYQGKEGSDELELLQTYRDFLSGHDLLPFWRFAAHYGIYLFRQREHEKDVQRWLPQFSRKGLDQLLMQNQQSTRHMMLAIMQTPGFQHIASAIREATVRAQRRVSQEKDSRYEVRYSLSQDLLRKTRLRDDFMVELGKFIAIYNAETAREEEKLAKRLSKRLDAKDYKTYRLRYPVTTADMEQFGQLLDTYPHATELVATMLVAYGSARVETFKQEGADTSNDEPTSQAEGQEEEEEEEA